MFYNSNLLRIYNWCPPKVHFRAVMRLRWLENGFLVDSNCENDSLRSTTVVKANFKCVGWTYTCSTSCCFSSTGPNTLSISAASKSSSNISGGSRGLSISESWFKGPIYIRRYHKIKHFACHREFFLHQNPRIKHTQNGWISEPVIGWK